MTPRINTADYVRPTTAARIAGVHRSRIDQLLTAGELSSVEIDGHRFIRRADAERLADAMDARRVTRPPT